ncbi:MAG: hypothetical protein LBS90_06900 [Oscillospiraceae bacterium]|jgi:ABC-type maltose transport system permease subunit|nr:hypothetical protein [Oscillospiraceae bacterium]
MKKYVPRTYNNRRRRRILVRVLLAAAVLLVVTVVVTFVYWQRYIVYTPAGVKLDLPVLRESVTDKK